VGSESVEETEVWKNALKKVIEELLQLMLSTVASITPSIKTSLPTKLGSSPTSNTNIHPHPIMLSTIPPPKDFDQMSAFDVTNSDVDDDDLYDLSDDTSEVENEYMSGNSVIEDIDQFEMPDPIVTTPKGKVTIKNEDNISLNSSS